MRQTQAAVRLFWVFWENKLTSKSYIDKVRKLQFHAQLYNSNHRNGTKFVWNGISD